MWYLDLLSVAFDPERPLALRDRLVVPLISPIAFALKGFSPENVVVTACITLAIGLFTLAQVCIQRQRLKLVCRLLCLACYGAAYYANNTLAPEPWTDRFYGEMPIASPKDFPILPRVDQLFTHKGQFFTDEFNRTVLLRGVNLGGDSKVPTAPLGETWNRDRFFETKEVSFVGRPFPLAEADEHLGRLSAWGFTFLRFIITWEAVEHEGPGIYDEAYLDYIVAVVERCAAFNISVMVDPHQDVWSRWTGGDGAPAWTLEKVGFDVEALYASGAAVSHQEHGDPFPQMIWPTNNNRLATATMFTLFFAGEVYAPNTLVDGVNVQEYLQSHYVAMLRTVAARLKHLPNVLGYDTMNEPSNGYVGLREITEAIFAAPLGWHMTAFQGMMLGHGHSVRVPFFSSPMVFQRVDELNPNGVLAWKSKAHDVWVNEGVWGHDAQGHPVVLKPHHFSRNGNGHPVDFMSDFMAPFFERVKEEIHSVHPQVVIFAEPHIDPVNPHHQPAPKNLTGNRYAWAPHYYDALTLLLKKARPWFALSVAQERPMFGRENADWAIRSDLEEVKHTAIELGGMTGQDLIANGKLESGAPVLLGETGIAMDLFRDESGVAEAYKNGDFTAQILALDRTMRALEANLLSFTLWTYAVGNSNKRGDLWNDEDLSLFSRDQKSAGIKTDLNSGGRALAAAVRPYPMKTCGQPLKLRFDALSNERRLIYEFETYKGDETVFFLYSYAKHRTCDPKVAPTIIYVPSYQYPKGIDCNVTDGSFTYDRKNQYLTYVHEKVSGKHRIDIVAKR